MKKVKNVLFITIYLLIEMLLFFCTINYRQKIVSAQDINQLLSGEYSDNSVIVVLDENISEINKIHSREFFDDNNLDSIIDLTWREKNKKSKNDDFRQILQLNFKSSTKETIAQSIRNLSNLSGVKSVRPNYLAKLEVVPNDSSFENLWGLDKELGIDAVSAWEITTGSKEINVGIIDTGIANHLDLNSNLGIGCDFYNNDTITIDDTHSHGTHVAGTIGAVGNNVNGVVGVNWNVTLVPLQASNNNNRFYTSDVIEAIEWAEDQWGTNNQIDIINYSVSGFGSDEIVLEAIRDYSGLFVWSAGNNETDIDEIITENGRFDLPNLISVGAVKENGERPNETDWGYDDKGLPQGSNFSTSGENVNIYAPGHTIYSTVLNNKYSSKSGTSMAAPHVSGVAALVLSVNPFLNAQAVKNIILDSADIITITLSDGSKQAVRKLNAYKAVNETPKPDVRYINSEEARVNGIGCLISKKLTIPYMINNHYIISIGPDAFANQTQITSITLPSTITSIGDFAFDGCSNLTTVNIPSNSNLQSIGAGVFAGCESLVSINLPNSLLSIGDSAFDGCSNLTTVNILSNGNLQSIGYGAFAGCESLVNINLPNSLLNIEELAFMDCSSLQSITIPINLTGIGNGAFEGCDKLSTIYYNARDCININGASYVDAFTNPSGVSAVTVHIGDTVEKLPADLFWRIEKVSSVILPDSIEEIGADVFYWNIHFKAYYEGTENDWANIVKQNWDDTFTYCIYYYADVQPTVDGNYWHYENNVVTQWKPVVIFMGVTANGESKTTDTTQLTLTFDKSPSDLTASDISVFGATKGALSGTGLTRTLKISNITVRNGGTVFVKVSPTDEYHIVGGSQPTTVYVKLYNILYYDVGGETFSGTHADGYPIEHTNGFMTTLKEATKVGYEFLGWYTNSECLGTPITSLSEDVIYDSDIILYVKWAATEFGYIANADKTEYSITIGAAGLANTNVTLPSTYKGKPITGIEARAFEESSLVSVVIPSSIKEIGNRAFFGCTGLTTVSFAENSQLISLGDYAFSGCSNLEAIQLPNTTVKSIAYFPMP